MKIQVGKTETFRPITIVLETEEEAESLHRAMVASDDIRAMTCIRLAEAIGEARK